MIYINRRYSDKAVMSFSMHAIKSIRSKVVDEVKLCNSKEEKIKLWRFISSNNVRRRIVMRPSEILEEIKFNIDNYPEVIECYLSDYYYRNALSIFPNKIFINSNKARQEFDNLVNLLHLKLLDVVIECGKSKLVIHLISRVERLLDEIMSLEVTSSRLTIKKEIKKIISLMKGRDIDRFVSQWVKSISKVYDYDTIMTQTHAIDLIKSLDIDVCPYCNEHRIEADNYRVRVGRKFRPALDHYYPKARYPFLALSVYNFVPSCHECNSSRKSDTDTYVNKYFNPYVEGLCSKGLFEIDNVVNLLCDKVFSKVKYTEIPLAFNLKSELGNRLDIFGLYYRYIERDSKYACKLAMPILNGYLKYERGENKSFLESLKSTKEDYIESTSGLCLVDSALKQEFRKLKIDIVNQLYNSTYKV